MCDDDFWPDKEDIHHGRKKINGRKIGKSRNGHHYTGNSLKVCNYYDFRRGRVIEEMYEIKHQIVDYRLNSLGCFVPMKLNEVCDASSSRRGYKKKEVDQEEIGEEETVDKTQEATTVANLSFLQDGLYIVRYSKTDSYVFPKKMGLVGRIINVGVPHCVYTLTNIIRTRNGKHSLDFHAIKSAPNLSSSNQCYCDLNTAGRKFADLVFRRANDAQMPGILIVVDESHDWFADFLVAFACVAYSGFAANEALRSVSEAKSKVRLPQPWTSTKRKCLAIHLKRFEREVKGRTVIVRRESE